MSQDSQQIVSFGQIDLNSEMLKNKPETSDLPILPTRDMVLFPGITVPISLGRETSLRTAEAAHAKNVVIGVVCQSSPDIEAPTVHQLRQYGVTARILQIFDVPDGGKMAIVHAFEKFKLIGPSEGATLPEASVSAQVRIIKETIPRPSDKEFKALINGITKTTLALIENSGPAMAELAINIKNAEGTNMLINLISTHAPFSSDFKIELLRESRLKERAFKLMVALSRDEQKSVLFKVIMDRTKAMLDDHQRKAFLRAQLDTIKEELYGEDEDIAQLKEQSQSVNFPENVRATFDKEVEKLERIQPQSPDYSVQYSYLQTLLGLPWSIEDEGNKDFHKAEEILDSEHFGLEKVKERILEQLAVIMNAPDSHAPIICLVGAPGVGKTSLGQSIASAMGRKYERVALGGLHDEAEIRGHRRTYIGAMPGRIISALKRCGTSNPVMLLDEIDKIGSDYRGDPSAALLEVLDPEQNCRFHDNYVDVDFDLSHVLFIATANSLTGVPQPLLDRMEVIEISGYLLEEKLEIAKRHLLPRLQKEMGIQQGDVTVTDAAIVSIIESYTAESGVRQLEKKLASLLRKSVLNKMRNGSNAISIDSADIKQYLGAAPYIKDKYEGNEYPGVVTGLAWTQAGGEILFIESSLAPGKAEKISLTGNLGDVMKESAVIALQYIKAHASQWSIDPEIFDKNTLHIHVPEGAIPKDGPSAGITMATSIASILTGRKVKERIAMTGEITLRGKVLPVGGIKEKILAAKRAGIDTIILSEANRKDIEEIKQEYVDGLRFIYVQNVKEVIDYALI